MSEKGGLYKEKIMENLNKSKLKPEQWFNDPLYNMIITPEVAEEGYKSEYRVQSFILQMKSQYFVEKIKEFRQKEPTAQKILITLPKSIPHGVYEKIHKELFGYPAEPLLYDRILYYYLVGKK